MIAKSSLSEYAGKALSRGESFVYAPPCAKLVPFLSCYTLTFPTPDTMSGAYTILPSASATIVVSVGERGMAVVLRGVNSRAQNVGAYAKWMRMILLIEFRPGCLYPFLSVDQCELLDRSLPLSDLDARLAAELADALSGAGSIPSLFARLDQILLARLKSPARQALVLSSIDMIRAHAGEIRARTLSDEFHYGEKQMRRIFLAHVGMGPKAFERVARVNRVARILQSPRVTRADAAQRAGYFDQPHLLRDFRDLCGASVGEYLSNLSDFYNDRYKI